MRKIIVGTHLLVSTPAFAKATAGKPSIIILACLQSVASRRKIGSRLPCLKKDLGFLEFTRFLIPHHCEMDRKPVLCSTTELPRPQLLAYYLSNFQSFSAVADTSAFGLLLIKFSVLFRRGGYLGASGTDRIRTCDQTVMSRPLCH